MTPARGRAASLGVLEGAFTAVLGQHEPFPAFEPEARLYLGVQVEGDEELEPRMPVGAALRAQWAARLTRDSRCASVFDVSPSNVAGWPSAGRRE